MELEKKVIKELRSKGYPVFNHNLSTFMVDDTGKRLTTICEFDIISHDFIIEVKSGRNIMSNGMQIMKQRDMMPNYKLYFYCPIKTDKEIDDCNKDNVSENVYYINNLEEVYKNHKPFNHANIRRHKLFSKFLHLTMDCLKTFDKIYTRRLIVYEQFIFLNHYYNFSGNNSKITWVDKLNYLLHSGKLVLVDKFDDDIPDFELKNCNKKIYINDYQELNIIKSYNIYDLDYEEIQENIIIRRQPTRTEKKHIHKAVYKDDIPSLQNLYN